MDNNYATTIVTLWHGARKQWTGSLAAFALSNGIDERGIIPIAERLSIGGSYEGGGGAEARYTLTLAGIAPTDWDEVRRDKEKMG